MNILGVKEMNEYYDMCYVSGCKKTASYRLKISARNNDGTFTTLCEIKYFCQTHYKNIGRMQMKNDLPVVIEQWNG